MKSIKLQIKAINVEEFSFVKSIFLNQSRISCIFGVTILPKLAIIISQHQLTRGNNIN
jgi:hypothetical protein